MGDADWRYSYRQNEPERKAFNMEALQRRLAKQRDMVTGNTSRRDCVLDRIRKAEVEQATRRNKAVHKKQRIASLLASSSSSGSCIDFSFDHSNASSTEP